MHVHVVEFNLNKVNELNSIHFKITVSKRRWKFHAQSNKLKTRNFTT